MNTQKEYLQFPNMFHGNQQLAEIRRIDKKVFENNQHKPESIFLLLRFLSRLQ